MLVSNNSYVSPTYQIFSNQHLVIASSYEEIPPPQTPSTNSSLRTPQGHVCPILSLLESLLTFALLRYILERLKIRTFPASFGDDRRNGIQPVFLRHCHIQRPQCLDLKFSVVCATSFHWREVFRFLPFFKKCIQLFGSILHPARVAKKGLVQDVQDFPLPSIG